MVRLGTKQVVISVAVLVLLGLAAAAVVTFWPRPVAPAPRLDTLKASVEHGRYLATVGNCETCHTAPGGEPYAGGVSFKTDFGKLYSTNITSDPHHGIGDWSFADFHASMKHGLRPDGTHLYPAFPYTSFAKLTDEDVASLYLYMKTIAPSDQPAPENAMAFPFNNRELMHFWKRLFHDETGFQPNPTKSEEWNRGAYLVEGLAHCGACHTPRNMFGAEYSDNPLTGGVYYDKVATGESKEWAAVNLTPAPDGLGAWSHQDIMQYLLEGQNSRAVVHGPMNEVVMDSTRHFAQEDVRAIATYLKGIPAREASSAKGSLLEWPSLANNYDEGEVVYTVHCGTCHLPDGKGDAVLGVPLGHNPIVQAKDPAALINVILYGPDLPPPPFVSDRTRMPAFGKRLPDEDIAAVATYLRNSFGNSASAVTAKQVREQR